MADFDSIILIFYTLLFSYLAIKIIIAIIKSDFFKDNLEHIFGIIGLILFVYSIKLYIKFAENGYFIPLIIGGLSLTYISIYSVFENKIKNMWTEVLISMCIFSFLLFPYYFSLIPKSKESSLNNIWFYAKVYPVIYGVFILLYIIFNRWQKSEEIKTLLSKIESLRKQKNSVENQIPSISKQIEEIVDHIKMIDIKINSLRNIKRDIIGEAGEKSPITVEDVKKLRGVEFERFLKTALEMLGYDIDMTIRSGDYGIDLIGTKDGVKVGFQVKGSKFTIGVKAIQEAVAGKGFYNLEEVYVITNSKFSKNAKILAQKNGVKLLDLNWILNNMPSESFVKRFQEVCNREEDLLQEKKLTRIKLKHYRAKLKKLLDVSKKIDEEVIRYEKRLRELRGDK